MNAIADAQYVWYIIRKCKMSAVFGVYNVIRDI